MSLMAHYKLDDNAANATVLDEVGSFNGTFKHSGSNHNTDNHHIAGRIDGALDFDGLTDCIDCGNIGVLTAYTIGCWVKIDDLVDSGDHNTYGFTIFSNSNKYACWLTVGKSGGTEVTLRAFSASVAGHTSSGANLNTADWFHIVATASKGGIAKIYVNGMEKLSFNADDNAWAGNFTIGDLRPNRHICFDGIIDEVRIWNHILTPAEIRYCYQRGKISKGPFAGGLRVM